MSNFLRNCVLELKSYFNECVGKDWETRRADTFSMIGWISSVSQADQHRSNEIYISSLPSNNFDYTLITGAQTLERLLLANKNWGACQTYKLNFIKKETKLIERMSSFIFVTGESFLDLLIHLPTLEICYIPMA